MVNCKQLLVVSFELDYSWSLMSFKVGKFASFEQVKGNVLKRQK